MDADGKRERERERKKERKKEREIYLNYKQGSAIAFD